MTTKPLKITDLNGFEIEVENLQLAIMQADDYRYIKHINPQCQQDDELQKAYWEDIYKKLLTLQQR